MQVKTPRYSARLSSYANQPSTALSQDALVGVKCNLKRGWLFQPLLDGSRFVGRTVIQNHMQIQPSGGAALNLLQESQKLLRSMALGNPSGDLAGHDVESRVQTRRTMALVIMRHFHITKLTLDHSKWIDLGPRQGFEVLDLCLAAPGGYTARYALASVPSLPR